MEAHTQEAAKAPAKPKTPVEAVTMEDGRTVEFAGKRQMLKEVIIDAGKIAVDGAVVQLEEGAVTIRFDFRNGKVLTHKPAINLYAQYIGHGGAQKVGDSAAGSEDVDDAILAVETTAQRLETGEWNVKSEGGSFSGASVVVKAIAEFKSVTTDVVKAFLKKKLDAAEAKGEKLTLRELYASFRQPSSPVYPIIKRMEEEKVTKNSKVDPGSVLAELE